MTAELSRRVGRVWLMPAIRLLPNDDQDDLQRDIEINADFEDLTPEHQDIILQAEEEWKTLKDEPIV